LGAIGRDNIAGSINWGANGYDCDS